jgi:L-amino acid N-acyltransferase YncA
MTVSVRDAEGSDIAALHAIYSHHVMNGLGTFDEVPPFGVRGEVAYVAFA